MDGQPTAGGVENLPAGILELRNALIDDLQDVGTGP
jgi:hypothetical protein